MAAEKLKGVGGHGLGLDQEPELSRQEAAAYIAEVALQLRNIAKKANMKFLTYLLEMVFQEAYSESGSTGKN